MIDILCSALLRIIPQGPPFVWCLIISWIYKANCLYWLLLLWWEDALLSFPIYTPFLPSQTSAVTPNYSCSLCWGSAFKAPATCFPFSLCFLSSPLASLASQSCSGLFCRSVRPLNSLTVLLCALHPCYSQRLAWILHCSLPSSIF